MNIVSLEPKGSVDAMKTFVNHATGSAKDTKAEQVTGDHTHVEETVQNENLDGHTADRTNMMPWDSCGPDCRVCTEFER